MSDPFDSKLIDDPAFQAVLVSCLEALQRGEAIDREQLASDHPHYAEAIQQFLDDQILLEQATLQFMPEHLAKRSSSGDVQTIANGSTLPTLSAGDTIRYIGEYEILGEIARGGMGVVFKAKQRTLKRIVALKMILVGKLASEADIERFRREARAAGRLKHPNIVPIHEVGEYEGHHYFTMDLVEGRSLAGLVREETLSPRHAAEMVAKVATAVNYAHQNGTLHRDLKPANILIDGEGEPHITDFGLAKLLEADDEDGHEDLTASGQVLGTPSYMSPEQASGRTALLGPASDIYSLGAILYSCVAGRAPFVAESTVDTIMQVLKKEPVAPRTLNPSIPRDLETICLKCLAKEPHKRYGTAQELADDLQRYLGGRPVLARPVSVLERGWRWTKRNPSVASLLAVIAVCLFMGTAIASYFAYEANQQAISARAETKAKEKQRQIAIRATADAEVARDSEEAARMKAEDALRATAWHLYRARLFPMRDAWEKQEFGHLARLLKNSIPVDEEPDFRGWEWYFYQDEANRRYTVIEPKASSFINARWSPRGEYLALRREDRNIEIRSGDDFSLLRIITGERQEQIAWHPSRQQLAAAARENEVELWDIATGEKLRTFATPDSDQTKMSNRGLDWSSEGNRLALGGFRRIDIWQSNGEHERTLASPPTWVPAIDWHPDGSRLGAAGVGFVFCIDIEADKVLWKNHRLREIVRDVEWDKQGKRLAAPWSWPTNHVRIYDEKNGTFAKMPATSSCKAIAWTGDDVIISANGDQQIYWLNVKSESVERTIRYHTSAIVDFDWVSERNLGVTVEKLGTAKVWNAAPVGLTATEIPTPAAWGQVPAWGEIVWHPREDLVACGVNDAIIVADVAKSEVIQTFAHPKRVVVSTFALHPSRRWIAYQDRNGKVYVRNIDSGAAIAEFTCASRDFNRSVAWSPNGRFLAAGSGQMWRSKNGGGVEVWDITTSEKVASLEVRRVRTRIAWSPDSSRLVVGAFSDRRLTVWDWASKNEVCTAELAGTTRTVAFSPDGRLVAAGSIAGPVEIVDANSGNVVASLASHSHAITSVQWSPDGSRIATADEDNTFRIWDAATAEELLVFDAEPIDSRFVCWSPDGRRLATYSGAGMIRILGSPQLVLPEHDDKVATRSLAK